MYINHVEKRTKKAVTLMGKEPTEISPGLVAPRSLSAIAHLQEWISLVRLLVCSRDCAVLAACCTINFRYYALSLERMPGVVMI